MTTTLLRRQISVKRSPIHGYGVFADEDIKKGDIIEECYAVILANRNEMKDFSYYVGDKSAMVLGYGSIYNHMDEGFNADYTHDMERSVMIYDALKDIKQGEEIFINYGDNWFASRHATVKSTSMRYQFFQFLRAIKNFSKGVFVTALLIAIVYIYRIYALNNG
jgi:hypothetical protein